MSAPGIEPLYSGVAIRTASAAATAARKPATASDGVLSVVLVERRQVAEALPDGELDAVREVLRRELQELPVVRARAQAACDAEDLHLRLLGSTSSSSAYELDVVADREAAGRERCVPVEAERRAVDDRLELEAEAGAAVERRG